MTRKDFKKSVAAVAKETLIKHQLLYRDVVVDGRKEIVSVGDIFFMQGEAATEFINVIPADINKRTWALFYLNSAGAI